VLANGLQTSLGTEVVMFMHSSAARFPMTRGAMVKFATALTTLILLVVLPLQFAVMVRVPVPEVRALALTVLVVVGLGLVFTVMLAPNAVRIEGGRLVVERWLWSDFSVPLRQLESAEPGPELRLFGDVRRVAGNGGLMGFTGLFHVKNVGTVRCWATQLGTPTVLVRRVSGRPLLLGVDDAPALLAALHHAGVR
jgi:hypothetical protein